MIDSPTLPIFNRFIDALVECLTPESARRIVALRADPVVQERIDYLADGCNEGSLTPEENHEYSTYVSYISFIDILQAESRRILGGPRGEIVTGIDQPRSAAFAPWACARGSSEVD